MHEGESLVGWANDVVGGDSEAEELLWNACVHDVRRFAKQSLRGARLREFDEEDVTASALHCLFTRLKDGRLTEVKTSRQLFALLRVIAKRKANDAIRRQRAERRGGGNVRGDSIFGQAGPSGAACDKTDPQMTPGDAAEANERLAALLTSLDCESLREIAKLRMAHFTNSEIADRLNVSQRTVERKLALIRSLLEAQE